MYEYVLEITSHDTSYIYSVYHSRQTYLSYILVCTNYNLVHGLRWNFEPFLECNAHHSTLKWMYYLTILVSNLCCYIVYDTQHLRDKRCTEERGREEDGRWRQTEGERERERETERGRGRGERERCKWWAAGCFRVVSDLFLSVGYLSFGEKTGKNGKRKKRREKETERKKKSWDGEQEDVSNWFQTSFGAGYGAT